ncbi:putative Zinc metalloproteinase nas-14 [Hypsibius exemplaris]|uniref:Metalloendopeptidase n=1 Tax=Hypsibius exemplaris TaxID=2072580 RepID=A0A9X6NHZ7_HYPEX|nr:putative Zinc metalloproteinase nas-14 [Hypsibius exemplaris]
MEVALYALAFFVCSVKAASLFPGDSANILGNVDGPRSGGSWDITTGHGGHDPVVRPTLFEGDIVGIIEAGDSESAIVNRLTKSGLTSHTRRWPEGIVIYELSSALSTSERSMLLAAFNEFNITDTVRFHPRSTQSDYVLIKKNEPGCFATIGKVGGVQYVNLASDCWTHGIIIHELMHTIGFYHEQARTDRDAYVELNLNNVSPAQRHNFQKYDASQVTPGGTAYDFDSITHYGPTEFAVNTSSWSLRAKAPNQIRPIGQRVRLSITDIREINTMYPNSVCAILYKDDGQTGPHLRFLKNTEATFDAEWFDSFSSARVTKACTLTIYSQAGLQGAWQWYRASTSEAYNWSFVGYSYDNFARSMKCVCP